MSDGTRTRGRRDHNPELYQLSYAHQAGPSIAAKRDEISPPWMRTAVFGKPCRVTMEMTFALTFDDGPDPVWTPAVLDALARRARARRRSSCSARRPSGTRTLVRRALAEGHAVELHGDEHLRHPRTPARAVADDLERGLAVLRAARRRARAAGARRGVTWRRSRLSWPRSHGLRARGLDGGHARLARRRGRRDARGGRARAARRARSCSPTTGSARARCRDGCAETVALIGPLVAAARERGLEPGPLDGPVPAGNPELVPA